MAVTADSNSAVAQQHNALALQYFDACRFVLPEPTLSERAAVLWQARLTLETTRLHPRQAILELRGQMAKYFPDDLPTRERIVRAESLADIEAAVGSSGPQ